MSDTLTGTQAKNYVGGEWRESASGESYEKRSPWRPSQVTGVYPGLGRSRRPRGGRGGGSRFPGLGGAARPRSGPPSSTRPPLRSRPAPSRSRRT